MYKHEREALKNEPYWVAFRRGLASAFADIAKHGYANAYHQSEVMDGGMDWQSPAHSFMYGYRQVVKGYWMADLIG